MKRFIGTLLSLPFVMIFLIAAVVYGFAIIFPVEKPVRMPRILRNIRFHP